MLNLQRIHKPQSLADALKLLQQPDTVVMGGGTNLIAERRRDVDAVVDLSALGLVGIETRGDEIVIGATTTLAALVESAVLRDIANGVLGRAAHRAHANILRNQATIAGTLIAEPDGIVAVTLCALDAQITRAYLTTEGIATEQTSCVDFFNRRQILLQNAILTELVLPGDARKRRAALETVARTPRDKPIVSACAALELEGGIVRAGAVALGGVAATAWRAQDAERELLYQGLTDEVINRAAMAATSGLNSPGDFRGSANYRTAMARVLTARALHMLKGG